MHINVRKAELVAQKNVRRLVREVPGPCAHWADEDADFIREVLDRIGDKWSVLVIGTLEAGPVRYTDLSEAIPGISQRMLTLTLRQLARDGIVSRTAFAEVPPRVEYALTPLGRSLLSGVLALSAWAVNHHAEVQTARSAHDRAAEKQLAAARR
jgi:DNA-binding HxlR family transcriptional regulator